jgi:hypothetical protein
VRQRTDICGVAITESTMYPLHTEIDLTGNALVTGLSNHRQALSAKAPETYPPAI